MREIEVEGCGKIRQEAIHSLILIEGMPNLFTVKLEEIAKGVEKHPWIDHFVMRKVFPNKIKVQIEERKPIAILQLEELYYIDAKGVIFSPVREGDGYNFPFLTGLTRQALDKDPETSKELLMRALELLRIAERGEGFAPQRGFRDPYVPVLWYGLLHQGQWIRGQDGERFLP